MAGALFAGGRVLLCHREPRRRWFPDVWDLPGGHVEVDEHPCEAVRRELMEELGVDVGVVPTEPSWRLVDDENSFELMVWRFETWTGRVVNAAPAEHDRLGWFGAAGLAVAELADERYRTVLTDLLAESAGYVRRRPRPPSG